MYLAIYHVALFARRIAAMPLFLFPLSCIQLLLMLFTHIQHMYAPMTTANPACGQPNKGINEIIMKHITRRIYPFPPI